LEYINGEQLDLSGIEVMLTYRDGTTRIVGLASFSREGITTNPVNNAVMSNSAHNNKRVEVTYTYNNQNLRAYTTPLSVQRKIIPTIAVAGKEVEIDSPDGNKFTHVSKCGEESAYVDITRENADIWVDGDNAQGSISVLKDLDYGDNPLGITLYTLSEQGIPLTQEDYTLTVKRPFPADELIKIRWGNTLTVIDPDNLNNPYDFASYKWYRNGKEIGSGRSWSAGVNGEKLNPKDNYYVEATTKSGKTIRSCEVTLPNIALQKHGILLKNNSAYANLGIDVSAPEETSEMEITVYNTSGKQVFSQKGNYYFNWNLTDAMHKNVPNGLYIVTAKAKGESGKIYRYSAKFVVKR